jgi:hypothetical protein
VLPPVPDAPLRLRPPSESGPARGEQPPAPSPATAGPERELLSPATVRARWGLDENDYAALVASGALPVHRLGPLPRHRPADLDALLLTGTGEPA